MTSAGRSLCSCGSYLQRFTVKHDCTLSKPVSIFRQRLTHSRSLAAPLVQLASECHIIDCSVIITLQQFLIPTACLTLLMLHANKKAPHQAAECNALLEMVATGQCSIGIIAGDLHSVNTTVNDQLGMLPRIACPIPIVKECMHYLS